MSLIKFPENITRMWKGIIIHHSFTADGHLLSSLEAIRKYHKEHNGWSDIGYHGVIEYVMNTLLWQNGRDFNIGGAHCIGKNFTHFGICIVGNFDETIPDEQTYQYTAERIVELMKVYPDITIDSIHRHSEYADKTCPGKNFSMDNLKNCIKNILNKEEK